MKKGDAVIVHGKLRSENWKREDGQVSNTLIVEASFVGHDLTRGTSVFHRSSRPERAETDVHDEIQEMVHRESGDTTQVDGWGNPRPVPNAQETVRRQDPAA